MRLVKVNKLFDPFYGVNLDLNKLEETDRNHGIPYVGRSEKNNGITSYVERVDTAPNPAMTISVAGGGTVMSCFLQESEYYSGRDLLYLKPKRTMTINQMLYYCTVLRANKFKFSYGRQANRTLKDLLIPDFEEIPDYVNRVEIDSSEEIGKFNQISAKVTDDANKLINSTFELENLDQLFTPINGVASTGFVVQPDRANKHLIPLVRPSKWQSTSYAGYVDERTVPDNKKFPAETLYVSSNGAGSHSYAYVSVEKFVPNSDVIVLTPKKKISLEEKLLYATLITANRFKFSYGRKPKGKRLDIVQLPLFDSKL